MKRGAIVAVTLLVILALLLAVPVFADGDGLDFRVYLPLVLRNWPLPPPPPLRGLGVEVEAVDYDHGWDRVREAGWEIVRFEALNWAEVEPSPSQYQWPSDLESQMEAAKTLGKQIVAIITGMPAWATDDGCSVMPDKLPHLTAFLREAAGRYGDYVDYWEMWDKPDLCWPPERYSAMLNTAYSVLRRQDTGVMVGSLALSSPDDDFLSSLTGPYDAVGFYAVASYGSDDANWNAGGYELIITKTEYVSNIAGDKYVVAILGMECEQADDTCTYAQADFIPKAFSEVWARGAVGIWHALTGSGNSDLLDAELNPLPPYYAYKVFRWETTEQEAELVGEVTDYEGIHGYSFTGQEFSLWVLWSADGEARSFTLPQNATWALDVFGNPIFFRSFDVGASPVYVEFW